MVVGENQRFLGALLTLKCEQDAVTGAPTNNLTKEVREIFLNELNLDLKTSEEAIANATV